MEKNKDRQELLLEVMAFVDGAKYNEAFDIEILISYLNQLCSVVNDTTNRKYKEIYQYLLNNKMIRVDENNQIEIVKPCPDGIFEETIEPEINVILDELGKLLKCAMCDDPKQNSIDGK
ncbi:MAG: hypothetical protein KBS56_02955 [Clostridiales bacterium]|nr:hypothetical protein [Candidatus Crickella equi]